MTSFGYQEIRLSMLHKIWNLINIGIYKCIFLREKVVLKLTQH